jgi:hypothetical protein
MTSPALTAVTVRSRTAALIALALLVATCGGATAPTATNNPAAAASASPSLRPSLRPTATTAATPTPTPRPTPTATPEPTPTLAPSRDVASGFRIGSPYRLRTLEPALATRLEPVLDGFTLAYRDYFTIGVREIQRSGAFEDVLLVFRLKSGVASSVIGSWDDFIKGATMGGTLKATTRLVSGVKVTYVSTNTFGLALFRLSGNRTYRNYIFELVGADQKKLAAATAAFIKAND